MDRRRLIVLSTLALGPFTVGAAFAQGPTGADSTEHPRGAVTFGQLPVPWVNQQNVMDGIWKAMGLRGVNYYAFGGPASPNTFSARSDPASPLYQAWIGAYVVVGADSSTSGNDSSRQALLVGLATLDQRSWLAAMGDPAPVATAGPMRLSQIVIDGVARPLYSGEMRSHSDLSDGSTPLAGRLGMPPEALRQGVAPFHDLTLHVRGAVWYDPRRHVTILVYSASSSFVSTSGAVRDNGPALDGLLVQAMKQVKVIDLPKSGSGS